MLYFINKNKYILSSLCILLIYLSPNIFFQNIARYLIHDNLDSNVVWYKVLGESGKMFSNNLSSIPNILYSIPRGCYFSEFNFFSIFYYLFSALTAYNINIVLMHSLAFFSMYVFLNKYIFKKEYEWAICLISLSFSLLPFWPSGGGTITGQPLLLFAFLNILNNEKKFLNWLIIFLFPFYSSLAFSNLFFILTLSLGFIIYTAYKKSINYKFILGLFIFTLASVIAEYRLFYMQFIEHFETHRDVIVNLGTLNLNGVLGVSISHFLMGQYHFYTVQFPFIILTCVLAFVFTKNNKYRYLLFFALCLIFINSLIFTLPKWTPISEFMKSKELLRTLALRFYSLSTLFWFLTFSFATYILLKCNDRFKYVFVSIGVSFILYLFFPFNLGDYYNSKYIENSMYNTFFNSNKSESQSFDQYYKTELFKKVKKYIPNNSYVACLGINPAIVQFNQYNTIDGYYYYYSKNYNKKINDICKLEMDKSNKKKLGGRGYLVCDDILKGKSVIDNLQLDFDELKKMGVNYFFCDRKIISPRLSGELKISTKNANIFIYTLN